MLHTSCCYGPNARNGLLPRAESTRIRDCTDGTSNTMIVGEQSGNAKFKIRTDYMSGWSAGHNANLSVKRLRELYPTGSGVFPISTGITVITGPRILLLPSHGNGSTRTQVQMYSFHTGGCHILLADGSVRFLSDNANGQLCRNLAVKDDGNVLGEF